MLFPDRRPQPEFEAAQVFGSAEATLREVFDPNGDDPETQFQINKVCAGGNGQPLTPVEEVRVATALALLQRDRLLSR